MSLLAQTRGFSLGLDLAVNYWQAHGLVNTRLFVCGDGACTMSFTLRHESPISIAVGIDHVSLLELAAIDSDVQDRVPDFVILTGTVRLRR